MKKIIMIILLINTNLFAQKNGIAEYEFSYKKFNNPPENTTVANARRDADMSAEYATDHRYILKFNSNESFYYVENSMPIDGIDNEFAYKFSKYIFSSGIFYQNRKTKEMLNKTVFMSESYLVKDSISYNWKITSDVKYIGKFKCFKAVSSCKTCNKKQTLTVWFTPEIAVPYGPAGYGGTPGLILEVSKYRYTLRLKKIKLSNKNIVIKKPSKGILITTDKFKRLQMERRVEIMKNRSSH